ncbi:MAG: histidinol-phosphate transaminase [Acidobacteria bacterium]|nr:histidinol-phosphate transaminase [Acidobacteriota bacterium]
MIRQPKLINSLSPYVPGKPIETVAREYGLDPSEIAKLASNENPLGTPQKVKDALHEAIDRVFIYPDGGAYYLREKMGKKFNIDPDWIFFGNGAAEIIEMAAKALLDVGETAMYSQYGFAMYKVATYASNHRGVEIPAGPGYHQDLDAFLKAIDDTTKIIYLSNPNNPTTTMIPAEELNRFVEQVPDHILIVIDEAYYEFVDNEQYPDSMKYIREQGRKNIIILRTFSKIYGLAGLRVGYGFAHPDLLFMLGKVRSPFNVNLLAQVACIAAMDCDDHVHASVAHVKKEKEFVLKELDRLGLRYLAEEGNFVAVNVERDVVPVFTEMQRRGVIVRPLQGYDMPEWFRMSFGHRYENEKFIRVLEEVL